jgi:hypothetical protein
VTSRIRSELAQTENVGFAQGPRNKLVPDLRKRERSGELKVNWEGAVWVPERGPGTVAIPYVRLRSAGSVQRRAYVKMLSLVVCSGGAAAGLGWMLWEARFVIMTVLGAALFFAGIGAILVLRGHSPGCTGLHCSGCRG